MPIKLIKNGPINHLNSTGVKLIKNGPIPHFNSTGVKLVKNGPIPHFNSTGVKFVKNVGTNNNQMKLYRTPKGFINKVGDAIVSTYHSANDFATNMDDLVIDTFTDTFTEYKDVWICYCFFQRMGQIFTPESTPERSNLRWVYGVVKESRSSSWRIAYQIYMYKHSLTVDIDRMADKISPFVYHRDVFVPIGPDRKYRELQFNPPTSNTCVWRYEIATPNMLLGIYNQFGTPALAGIDQSNPNDMLGSTFVDTLTDFSDVWVCKYFCLKPNITLTSGSTGLTTSDGTPIRSETLWVYGVVKESHSSLWIHKYMSTYFYKIADSFGIDNMMDNDNFNVTPRDVFVPKGPISKLIWTRRELKNNYTMSLYETLTTDERLQISKTYGSQ